MATYLLPNVTRRSDVYSIQFLNAVEGLTVPSVNALVKIGPKREKIDGDTVFGMVIPENLTLTFIDVNNFFDGLLNGPCEVLIRRNGSLEFWGIVERKSAEWGEKYINGTVKRVVEFTCVHMISKLKERTAHEVIQNILTNDIRHPVVCIPARNAAFVNIDSLFRPFMMDFFGTGATNAEPLLTENHFRYYTSLGQAAPGVAWDNLAVRVGTATSTHAFVPEGYFDENSTFYLGKTYSNALELLVGLARQFGFIPKVSYAEGWTNEWMLSLPPRRIISGTASQFPAAVSNGKRRKFGLFPLSFSFKHGAGDGEEAWYYFDGGGVGHQGYNVKPPDGVNFDVQQTLLWGPNNIVTGDNNYELYHLDVPNNTFYVISHVDYYSFNINNWSSKLDKITHAVLNYYIPQWAGEKLEYDRSVKGLYDFNPFAKVTLADVAGKQFYVSGKERDYDSNGETYYLIEI